MFKDKRRDKRPLIDFDGEVKPRGAFRIEAPGLVAHVRGVGTFVVRDVSVKGLCLVDAAELVGRTETFDCDLELSGKMIITGLPARTAWQGDEGEVGLSFENLPLRRELLVDKLVLDMQKRLIAQKKSRPE